MPLVVQDEDAVSIAAPPCAPSGAPRAPPGAPRGFRIAGEEVAPTSACHVLAEPSGFRVADDEESGFALPKVLGDAPVALSMPQPSRIVVEDEPVQSALVASGRLR